MAILPYNLLYCDAIFNGEALQQNADWNATAGERPKELGHHLLPVFESTLMTHTNRL